jgi:hypothetical protein
MNWRRAATVLLLVVICTVGHAQPQVTPGPSWVDGPTHENVEVTIDLPVDQHVKNFGAPRDHAGLCVFASMDMAARWHHITELIDVIHQLQNGGGWPAKVDRVIQEHAPGRRYLQYEGSSPDMLDGAMAVRIPVCVTYGYAPRYGQQTIYHMVILVHLDKKWAAVIDNNFPGTYEWMGREEFLRRWTHPSGKGWAYKFIEAPPPPIPRSTD